MISKTWSTACNDVAVTLQLSNAKAIRQNTANQLSYIDLTCLKQWIKGEAFSKHAQIFTILQDPQWFTKLRINSSYILINKFSFEGKEIKQIIHSYGYPLSFCHKKA